MSEFKTDLMVNQEGFGLYYNRMENNLKSLADISAYFKKLSKAENNYYKEITSICRSNENKLWRKTDQEIGTFAAAWNTFHEEILKIAQQHEDMSQLYVNESTILDKYIREKTNTKKQLMKDGSKLTRELNDALSNLKRSEEAYYRDHKSADALEATYNTKKSEPNAKAKEIEKLNKKATEARDKCKNSDVNYQKMLDAANNAQNKFYSTDMPHLLQQFQVQEEDKTAYFKKLLDSYMQAFSKYPDLCTSVVSTLNQSVKEIEPKKDVSTFIQKNKSSAVSRPSEILYKPYGGGAAVRRTSTGNAQGSNNLGVSSARDIKKSEPVKNYGLTNDDASLSADEKKSKLNEQLKEVKERIKNETKSKKGLEKLTQFYANDPVAQQKTQREVAELQNIIDKLKGEKKKLLNQVADVEAGGSGGSTGGGGGSGKKNSNAAEDGGGAGGSGGAGASAIVKNAEKHHHHVQEEQEGGEYLEVEARAMFDYEAANDTELAFKAGDILLITEQDSSGWWYAEHNGKQGFIPNNYVELIEK